MKNLCSIIVGPLAENCYLVWDDADMRALVFDPGDDSSRIVERVEARGVSLEGILLTHAHFDHIGAVPALVSRYDIPVWCPTGDREIYLSPENSMPPWYPAVENLPALSDRPLPEFGFQLLKTPGHTPGGTSYYFPTEGFVLTGDTLFAGSVGRTDFPGGSEEALMHSIRQVLFALPPSTVVYPGHGPRTTIGTERMDPFFGMP